MTVSSLFKVLLDKSPSLWYNALASTVCDLSCMSAMGRLSTVKEWRSVTAHCKPKNPPCQGGFFRCAAAALIAAHPAARHGAALGGVAPPLRSGSKPRLLVPRSGSPATMTAAGPAARTGPGVFATPPRPPPRRGERISGVWYGAFSFIFGPSVGAGSPASGRLMPRS